MTYNVTINDEELKALRDLWMFSNYECIKNEHCKTCRFFNEFTNECKSYTAYNIVKKCVEWSVKFERKED